MPRRRTPLRSRAALAAAAAIALVTLAACGEREDAELHVSAQERVLMDRLTRDPLLEIVDLQRNEDGFLVISTRQGDMEAQYLLAPDGPASKQITIRRMDPGFSIESAVSPAPGIGPAARGIAH